MKTKYFIFTLALISGSAYAQSSGFEGFNVGLGLGYVQPDVVYTDNLSGYYKWEKNDLVVHIDASYHKAINATWLVGIGLTSDLNDTNAGTKSEAYGPVETTLKKHRSIYIQPTYAIDGASAAFAKIGRHSIRVNGIGQPGSFWIDDIFSTHGIGYGAGYKKLINKNFFAQAEIQIVDYKDKSFSDGGIEWAYKQKTAAGIFTAGYKF